MAHAGGVICEASATDSCRYLREHNDAREELVAALSDQGLAEKEARAELDVILSQTEALDSSASSAQVLRAPTFDDVRDAVRSAASLAHNSESSTQRVVAVVQGQLEALKGKGPETEAARAYLLAQLEAAAQARGGAAIDSVQDSVLGMVDRAERVTLSDVVSSATEAGAPAGERVKSAYAAAREAFLTGDASGLAEVAHSAVGSLKPGAESAASRAKSVASSLLELDLTDQERAARQEDEAAKAESRKKVLFDGFERLKQESKRGVRARIARTNNSPDETGQSDTQPTAAKGPAERP